MLILNHMYMYFCGSDFSVILTFGHRCGLTGLSQSSSAYGPACQRNSYVLPCSHFDRVQTPEPLCSESELRTFRKKNQNNFGLQASSTATNVTQISHHTYNGHRHSLPSNSSGAGTSLPCCFHLQSVSNGQLTPQKG